MQCVIYEKDFKIPKFIFILVKNILIYHQRETIYKST